VVVVVATVRALKNHGGISKAALNEENMEALAAGFENLEKQIENVKKFGVPAVVAINAFPTDTAQELEYVRAKCLEQGVEVVLSEVWAKGGEGGVQLAQKVVELAENGLNEFKPLYDLNLSIKEKIETIAREIYGADGVDFTGKALKEIETFEKIGLGNLPVCMAKTQYSLSDNPKLLGRPKGFKITVSTVRASAGAGFLVVLTGDVMTMPGLPKVPAANHINVLESGEIVGLF